MEGDTALSPPEASSLDRDGEGTTSKISEKLRTPEPKFKSSKFEKCLTKILFLTDPVFLIPFQCFNSLPIFKKCNNINCNWPLNLKAF